MNTADATQAIDAFLRALGQSPLENRHTLGTGARVAEAFANDLLSGYGVDADALLRAERSAGTTELVAIRNIEVTTTCPHHLMPAWGHATIAFAPQAALVGIGTLAKILDCYARRLTLQEEIGEAVVDAIFRNIEPRWVGCRLVLSHACMTARGERKHGSRVETIALRGEVDRQFSLAALGVCA